MLRRHDYHDLSPQRHCGHAIFGRRKYERRLFSLQMGNRIWNAPRWSNRENIQHNSIIEPRRNADDRSYLFLHCEGHWL